MELTETQKTKLAEAVENVLQSRNFGGELATYDDYIHVEMVKDALEQNDVPQDIEPKDINHELTLTSKLNSEAWADVLGQNAIQNRDELNKLVEDEDELVQAMLLQDDDNFDAEVEIKEEISEVRNRKPTKETLKDEMEEVYDSYEFGEFLEENENETLQQAVRDSANDEGFPQDVELKDIDYTIDDITFTQSFDAVAEKYLDDAEESEDVRGFVAENLYSILENEKQFKVKIRIESDPEDVGA
ncbi:hypothetical protein [Staphylococcus warneri]|uniref:hypothetical protein n=1 Tax=Staphylococcus warneri TaxID=1292 RepID=UPI0022DFB0A8|nr:hypothetical protein [Staphylococcus warneri]